MSTTQFIGLLIGIPVMTIGLSVFLYNLAEKYSEEAIRTEEDAKKKV